MLSEPKYGENRFIHVQGYRIHYIEVGAGSPVILVAGSYSTYRVWNRVIPLLAGYFRLLAVDYVGSGDSDKPQEGFGYSVQEQAGLITGLVRKLELGPVHLLGVSYGGAIVLNLAAKHPELVNKVVSIEGGIIRPKSLPTSPMEYLIKYPVIGDLMIALAKTGALNAALVRLIAGKWYPAMTAEDRRELREQLYYNARSASRTSWYWITVSHKTCEDFEDAARRMKMPILYLYGRESTFMETLLKENIAFLETYLPHARIIGLDGGIHDLELQKPDEVAELVLSFLMN